MHHSARLFILSTAVVFAIAAYAAKGSDTYTLYRSSVFDTSTMLFAATFDTAEGAPYNCENCEQARGFFNGQPSVQTKFWCEPVSFQSSVGRSQPNPRLSMGEGIELTCSLSVSETVKPSSLLQPVDYRCPCET